MEGSKFLKEHKTPSLSCGLSLMFRRVYDRRQAVLYERSVPVRRSFFTSYGGEPRSLGASTDRIPSTSVGRPMRCDTNYQIRGGKLDLAGKHGPRASTTIPRLILLMERVPFRVFFQMLHRFRRPDAAFFVWMALFRDERTVGDTVSIAC